MLRKNRRINSPSNCSRKSGVVAGLGCLAVSFCVARAADADARTIEYDRSEAAMIIAWNGAGQPWPLDECFAAPPRANPAYLQIQGDDEARFHFDAVHRRLLVRFPGLAERVHAVLAEGHALERVELVLEWANQDVEVPSGGYVSQGRARDVYRADPGRWSVVAAALRRPWEAHPEHGPTWNSPVRGAGYWKRHGARDTEHDRYPTRFGPEPLHAEARTARLDVTETLTDPAYGATPAERLRRLEQQGFILRKHETWEPKYGEVGSAYDWFVATGGHAIYIDPPRLVIHLAEDAGADPGGLLPAVDIAAPAAEEPGGGNGDGPPTWIPGAELDPVLAERELPRPDGLPDWQWQRIQEVLPLGRVRARRPRTTAELIEICDGILSRPPRWYLGTGVQDWILFEREYGDLMPPHVADHLASWWEAWLLPQFHREGLVHPQAGGPLRLQHGRASFYRGFTHTESTVGFNHRAIEGALFGGDFLQRQGLDARHPLDDARHGMENLLLRHWVFRDGSMQDMISGHYTALHLSFQAMFAQYGPETRDRLAGRIMFDNTLELPISAYHPGLRRIVFVGGRSFPDQLFLTQEGLYYMLHTLTRQGALIHLGHDTNQLHGMQIFGDHFPGNRVARMSPLQPPHVVNMVDDKPLPYRITAAETVRGAFRDPPLMQRVYLGRHYGLASMDLSNGLLPVVAQWRRTEEPVAAVEELGSLVVKFDANDIKLPVPGGGYAQRTHGEGALVCMQHDNTTIVVATPGKREQILEAAGPDGLRSLQATVGLYSFQQTPTWEIYVDDERIDGFPISVSFGQAVTLKDGVSYVGILPLEATDLGRSEELVIDYTFPALRVTSYFMLRDQAVNANELDWDAVNRAAGGFVVNIGDVTEFGTFKSFREHLQAARLTREWTDSGVIHLDYLSGDDHLEMGVGTAFQAHARHYPVSPGSEREVIAYRRVNGQWPYLPPGIVRDTTLTIQGTSGELVKNAAVLRSTPGHMMYLQTEPRSGTTVAYNPLPDPVMFELLTPEGIRIKADGRLGIARVLVAAKDGRIEIDCDPDPAAQTATPSELRMQKFQLARGSGHGAQTVYDPDAGNQIAQMRDLAEAPGTYPFIGRGYLGPLPPGNYRARMRLKWVPLEEDPDVQWHYRVRLLESDREIATAIRRNADGDELHAQAPGDYHDYDLPFTVPTEQHVTVSLWPLAGNGQHRMYADTLTIERLDVSETATPSATPGHGMAQRLLVFGLDAPPEVTLNGRRHQDVRVEEIDGVHVHTVPLAD